eukprot:scaffold32712_cov20-Tisochrysis_lutea.AAC.3
MPELVRSALYMALMRRCSVWNESRFVVCIALAGVQPPVSLRVPSKMGRHLMPCMPVRRRGDLLNLA